MELAGVVSLDGRRTISPTSPCGVWYGRRVPDESCGCLWCWQARHFGWSLVEGWIGRDSVKFRDADVAGIAATDAQVIANAVEDILDGRTCVEETTPELLKSSRIEDVAAQQCPLIWHV